jgi:predicted NBD/HSP70 family sugar kinase
MVGIELTDSGATAVVVDDEGRVSARGQARGSDAGAATLAALGELGQTPFTPSLATALPESAAAVAAMQALRSRFGSALRQERPIPSGTAAAVAEAWTGAASGRSSVVFFGIAEHAVAGILRDGVPATGAHGRAPIVAWLALNPVEREDYRKTGCLEAEVASAGIVRRLIWRIKAGDRSRIQDGRGADLSGVSLDDVLQAARGGDGVSISVMRDTAKYLGMAAANLVAIADPEILVLGGIMASAADLLFEPVRVELARRLPVPMMEALTVAPAALGSDAAAIGAARLAQSAR